MKSQTSIVKRAWEITWKHKALWLFGFLLAAMGAGGGDGRGGEGVRYTFESGRQLSPAAVVAIVIGVIGLVLVAIVVAAAVRMISQGALIGMVNQIEESGSTGIRSGFRTGWKHMLRLLGIDLLIGIPAAVVVVVTLLLALAPLLLLASRRPAAGTLGVVLMILFMLLWIALLVVGGAVLSVILGLAHRHGVLQGLGVVDSLREGYHMARANLGYVVKLWLLQVAIGLAVGLLAIPVLLVAFAFVAVPAAIVWGVTEASGPAAVVAVVLGIPVALALVVAAGIYQVYESAVWTLAFHELTVGATAA